MEKLFLSICHMSLTASYVIAFVILVRLLLRKAPKNIPYVLWSVVAFRLICPYSLEGIFSLIPKSSMIIPGNTSWGKSLLPDTASFTGTFTGTFTGGSTESLLSYPTKLTSVNPIQIVQWGLSWLWLSGVILMICYSMVSVILLKIRLNNARLMERNIYEAENLYTPFVLGILHPRIYLPAGLNAEEKSYILRHEQTHIRRFDHIIKLFAYFLLSLHWFNPLVWIAFLLMSNDMELSCDEKVIKEMGGAIRKAYSASLLSLAAGKRILNGGPLAFGEGNVKQRIKNILNDKRPPFWLMVVMAVIAVTVGIGLLVNPKSDPKPQEKESPVDNNSLGLSEDEFTVSYELSWYKNGVGQGTPIPLTGDNAEFAMGVIFNYMIKSAAWPGVQPTTLEEVYLVRASYSDGTYTDYFAYLVDGKAVMQRGYDGSYSRIDDGMYEKLVLLAKASTSVDGITNIPEPISEDSSKIDLEACVHDAIITENADGYLSGDIATEAHIILKTVVDKDVTTVYAMALYLVFNAKEDRLEEIGGSHMPVAITFTQNEEGEYMLQEYWMPQDGSYYATSIREKFPADISENAIDTQKYVMAQTQSCYAQAIEYANISVDQHLKDLITVICSSPLYASDPQSYMKEHPIEYRELLYYSNHTLRYCFQMFEQGGQTGLEGHIMAFACREILGNMGGDLPAENGQVWYEAFKEWVRTQFEEEGGSYSKENPPDTWMLLQMLLEMNQ